MHIHCTVVVYTCNELKIKAMKFNEIKVGDLIKKNTLLVTCKSSYDDYLDTTGSFNEIEVIELAKDSVKGLKASEDVLLFHDHKVENYTSFCKYLPNLKNRVPVRYRLVEMVNSDDWRHVTTIDIEIDRIFIHGVYSSSRHNFKFLDNFFYNSNDFVSFLDRTVGKDKWKILMEEPQSIPVKN